MPRFFIHLEVNERTLLDIAGQELPDLDTAVREGEAQARELAETHGRLGDDVFVSCFIVSENESQCESDDSLLH